MKVYHHPHEKMKLKVYHARWVYQDVLYKKYQKMITVFQKSRASFHAVVFSPFLFNATRLTSWKVICLCTTADRHLGHVNFGNLLMEFWDRRCYISVGKPGWESPRELLT